MRRAPWSLASLALAFAACLTTRGIEYALDPEEFTADFGSATGNFPDVDCSTDAMCSGVPNLPQGFTTACDTSINKCVASYDLRLLQQVNLSQQKGFPEQVATSPVASAVSVEAVNYWTPSNTLSFDSPAIDIYVGGQAVQKETDAGAMKLGTVSALPAKQRTACGGGAAGTRDSACGVALTDDGVHALALLAKEYRTPFNVIAVAHVIAHAGDPLPAGKLDLVVQPVLLFSIP
jgi:hypothetical protein